MSPIEQSGSSPVGVFDSGVGGLSVLKALLRELPADDFVFFADEAHLPYGDKPQHEITERVLRVSSWLRQHGTKALVLACNTATAAGAAQVRQAHAHWPIVGIEPAVKPASMMTKTGVVGILATTNTVASDRFRTLVERFDPLAHVLAKPCPGLVELIEQVPMDKAAVAAHLTPVVNEFVSSGVDVIVLGCTHYPFVSDVIESLAGPGVRVIETGVPVARQLASRLGEAGLMRPAGAARSDSQRVTFVTTGDPQRFSEKLSALMGDAWRNSPVKQIAV